MKKYNVTGACIPEKHYMVDISGKLSQIIGIIGDKEYEDFRDIGVIIDYGENRRGSAMFTDNELQKMLHEIKSASEQLYGNKLNRIILFGSYARGNHTDESDIDVLIILNCDAGEIKRLRGRTAEMASNISLEHEVFLSVLLRDKKHFEEYRDFLPLYKNIVKEGVVVYG